MTSRMSLFDHPFFLGFDQLEREFDRLKKSADGYPPYNVEQIDDSGLRITLAVAGFTHDDLDIELAHNQLTVRGKMHEDEEDEGRVFLHRGIAARQFQRSFMIADGIEIKGASLDNGLLHIEMQRVIPETQSRKINIEYSGSKPATNRKEQLPAQDVEVERQDSRDVASLKTAQKTAQEARKRG